jgi:hypothetical protein
MRRKGSAKQPRTQASRLGGEGVKQKGSEATCGAKAATPLLILDEDDGWSGLPSWLRQWVSDGADMLKCTSLVTSMVRIAPPLATTLQRSLRCSGLQ